MHIISLSSLALFSFCTVGLDTGSRSSTEHFAHRIFVSRKTYSNIKTEDISYISNGKSSIGYVAYDENQKGKRPVVIIVHEWWGLNEYSKSRAAQMASLVYFLVDDDVFVAGQQGGDNDEAKALTKPYY